MESHRPETEIRPRWFTEMSLADSLRLGECLVCSNLIYSERRHIYSFLWEGMMSNHVRTKFLEGGGFCARHFWMAKGLEEDAWRAGGIGLAILCEDLVGEAMRSFMDNESTGHTKPQRVYPWNKKPRVSPPSLDCIFCRDWAEREESIVEALESLKNKPQWSKALDESPLCVRHVRLTLDIWKNSEDKQQVVRGLEARLRELQADLKEWIGKHDWNRREEPLGREQDAVERAIGILVGLERQFPHRDATGNGGKNDGARKR